MRLEAVSNSIRSEIDLRSIIIYTDHFDERMEHILGSGKTHNQMERENYTRLRLR